MKNTYCYFLAMALLSLVCFSCKTVRMGEPPEFHEAYLKTNAGTTVNADKLKEKAGKLVADGTAYKKKDVAEFAIDGDKYVKLNGKSFAKLAFKGDINVYTKTTHYSNTTYSPGGGGMGGSYHTSSGTSTQYYFQKAGTVKLMPLKYDALSPLITPRDAGYKYMTTFKKNRTASRIFTYASLGVTAAGIFMIAKGSDSVGEIGLLGVMTGIVTLPIGLIWGAHKNVNLGKAIGAHNGVKY